jgi:hypothetical protein
MCCIRFTVQLWQDKRDVQVGHKAVEMENQLACILAATGKRLVPKISVDGDVHNLDVYDIKAFQTLSAGCL